MLLLRIGGIDGIGGIQALLDSNRGGLSQPKKAMFGFAEVIIHHITDTLKTDHLESDDIDISYQSLVAGPECARAFQLGLQEVRGAASVAAALTTLETEVFKQLRDKVFHARASVVTNYFMMLNTDRFINTSNAQSQRDQFKHCKGEQW